MDEVYRLDEALAFGIEAIASAIVVFAAASAAWRILIVQFRKTKPYTRKDVWRDFAGWLVMALEFMLAADLVRTAVSPTWEDIAGLAAIAAIRTFLNYFLEVDIRKSMEIEKPPTVQAAT